MSFQFQKLHNFKLDYSNCCDTGQLVLFPSTQDLQQEKDEGKGQHYVIIGQFFSSG